MYNNAREILIVETEEPDINKRLNEIQLSKRSEEIDIRTQAKEMREIVSALKQTMDKHNLTMLAAPEIGYEKRIFCIRFDTEIKTFINPLLVGGEGLELAKETSVVLPNKMFLRPRCSKITIMYQRPTGQSESREFLGLAAILAQQMFDALDGIIETDIGLEIDEDFLNASEEEKDEIIKMYLDSLDLATKNINQQIQEDPEAKEIQDAINFMTSVAKGETKLAKGEENVNTSKKG